MSRQVISKRDIKRYHKLGKASKSHADTTIPIKADQYVDRLLKYIPAEVVACYVFVLGIMNRLTDPTEIIVIQWGIFVVFCILTYLYLWRILEVRKIQQLAISLMAFVIWVFALGGPFTLLGWYNPIYGEILLPIFTFGIAIWEAEK